MAQIISILLISLIGCFVTGIDFFILVTLASFYIDIYKILTKLQKKFSKRKKKKKNTKDKAPKW